MMTSDCSSCPVLISQQQNSVDIERPERVSYFGTYLNATLPSLWYNIAFSSAHRWTDSRDEYWC